MKKSRLKEAMQKSLKKAQAAPSDTQEMRQTAELFVKHAEEGRQEIAHIANFIFFSTLSGEAWLLDHRDNLALRLANAHKKLEYTLIEDKTNFSVNWTERFEIRDGVFIAKRKGKATTYQNYPVNELSFLIDQIKKAYS